jgi:hypothetical protein
MRLRERKHRYGKPLAVMVKDVEAARALCADCGEEEALLLTTAARPIVLARKKRGRGLRRVLRRGFRGWGCFCRMRRCSICCLPMDACGAGDDERESERGADCD